MNISKKWALSLVGMALASGNLIGAETKTDLLKVGGLAQAWLFNDTTVTAAKPNFRLRRAEIKFTATPSDMMKAFIMVDGAKAIGTTSTTVVTATTPAVTTTSVNGVNTAADTKVLQDLGVVLMPIPDLEITLGQFKVPTTAEGLDSSAELLLPERSIVGRTFGDKREPGGMISYKNSGLKAMLMFSNGQATNVDDNNNNKDLTLRLEYDVLPELKVGGFTHAGDFSYGTRAKHGLNARYTTDSYTIRVEGVHQSVSNNTVKTDGLMGEAAYTWQNWQPVFRYEYLKPNTALSQAGQGFTLGLNYLVSGNKSKVQLAGTVLKDMSGANGSPSISTATAGMNGTILYLAFSTAI